MQKKHITANFEIKGVEEDGTFTGYASVFNVIDSQNDAILKGAFEKTIKKRKGDIKMLWQHKVDEPIGNFIYLREDSHGLLVKGKLMLDVQRAKEAYALLQSGVINGMSIGYAVLEADYNDEIGVRLIVEVDLFEVSLVTFPANEDAVITSVKNSEISTMRDMQKLLVKKGYSYKEAEAIAARQFEGQSLDSEFDALERSIDEALGVII